MQTPAQDIDYVESLELPDEPAGARLESTPVEFGSAQEVATVGAQLAEFSEAVPAAQRAVVADCLLLAQLAADKATAMNDDLQAWYDQYLKVLKALGWLQTSMDFKATEVSDDNAGVHQAILPVLTAMLGPVAASASMVVAVLKGLQEMNKDDPWITLFDRSSSHARGAKFQLGFVDADPTGDTVKVQLMALAIDAQRRVTQVLFFKLAQESAKLAVAQGELSVGAERLNGIRQAVADKVAPFVVDNIGKIDI